MTRRLKVLLVVLGLACIAAVVRVSTAQRRGPGWLPYTKGSSALAEGELGKAINSLRQAVILEPLNGEYHADLGNACLQATMPHMAAAESEVAAYLVPGHPHLFCQLAQAKLELRRREEALAALDEALKRTPDCAHALGVKAELHLRDDNRKEALATYSRLVQLAPGTVMAHQKVALLLLSVDRVDVAISELEKSLSVFPADPSLNALLGEAYARRPSLAGSFEKAVSHLKRAIPNNPEAVNAHSLLGKLYLRKGELKEARREYEAALALRPTFPEAQYGLSQVAAREGRTAEADTLLKASHQAQQIVRRIAEAQSSAEARPADVEAQLKVVRLCLSSGLLNPAARALENAVRIDPARAETRELRSVLFRALGQGSRSAQESSIAATLRSGKR